MVEIEDVTVQTRTKNHENNEKEPKKKEPAMSETTPLEIKKLSSSITLISLKVTLKRETCNPCSQMTRNYNVIEDLAQAPYAMCVVEVL